MKIYWKNLIFNYTGRYWYLFKYYKHGLHKSKWKGFYYPGKKFWNSRQEVELEKKLKEEMLKMEWQIWNDPLIHIPIIRRDKE